MLVVLNPPLLCKKWQLDLGLLNWLSTVSAYDFSLSAFISSFSLSQNNNVGEVLASASIDFTLGIK